SYERSRSEIKMSRLMDAITHMSQYMWEGVIDAPLLNIGEKLYIEDLDVEIIVSERIRHTNGSYIYKTEHQLDLVENEDSLRSKNETREKEQANSKNIEELSAELKKLRQETGGEHRTEYDNYYDSNGYLRTFPKHETYKRQNKKSWIERLFG